MEEPWEPNATEIDLKTWERRPLYDLFTSFTEPFHGVCVRIDCTESFRFAKNTGGSVFLTLLHRALAAAQHVQNLRTRIVGGSVLNYATIHGGSPVGRPNGTIGFAYYRYQPELALFVRDAAVEVERVKNRTDIQRNSRQDVIRFSVLPWVDFTSISHARDFHTQDSAPKITFGKITKANGRQTMPVSIHAHHALADGLHVAQFVERFQQHLADPELH